MHDEAQRQAAGRFDGVAHAGDAEHVRELVRIPEDGGGALRHHHGGVVMRQHVRGFDMNVGVDEARRDDAIMHVVRLARRR